MKRILTLFILFTILGSFGIQAQESNELKLITLEDIWKKGTFSSESVRGLRSMNDGMHYTVLEKTENGSALVKYNYKSGKKVATIVSPEDLKIGETQLKMNAYEFSADEKKVLIATELESIYRRSTKAFYYVLDLNRKELQKLSEGDKQMYADFSPLGDMVAFVKNNDLYYKDLSNEKEIKITTDGEYNKIINGASDWVYEEELSLSQAFAWSPDGEKIAFYKFDESEVKQ